MREKTWPGLTMRCAVPAAAYRARCGPAHRCRRGKRDTCTGIPLRTPESDSQSRFRGRPGRRPALAGRLPAAMASSTQLVGLIAIDIGRRQIAQPFATVSEPRYPRRRHPTPGNRPALGGTEIRRCVVSGPNRRDGGRQRRLVAIENGIERRRACKALRRHPRGCRRSSSLTSCRPRASRSRRYSRGRSRTGA